MNNINFEEIDTKSLLEDLGIEYSEHGKNIGSGWIGLECPFCGDSSNHCRINLQANTFNCWVCQEKGTIIKLLKKLTGKSYQHISNLILNHTKVNLYTQTDEYNPTQLNVNSQFRREWVSWPTPILDHLPPLHRKYLESRNFDPDLITSKYQLRFTPNVGRYRFGIIAPIILNGKKISWIFADIIRNESRKKYIKCPNSMSIIPPNSCLYNIDSVTSTAILVEGIADTWRCGNGFVATMTKSITSDQILTLVKKNVKKVFVMFDSDAKSRAEETALKLSSLFETGIIELSEGDPADLSLNEVYEVRKLFLE
jgi:hypothetical protein